ncbi:hypothetical protein AMELA_G00186390 [Ameiurus melas]|uniref:Uncharacterized protein n=1 Tax=Ameiurus melas TaxID=219545 RepID=A0A7J6A7Q0_AMEME|nr:hypothetical protein AMELA_G00186390 [Ameiurus melas]
MLTVSIRNVTEQDSGEYWCGAEANWTSDHGYKVYFTQINLTVTESSSELYPASPPAGFTASTVITVSVILLLLLIGIIFLFVILQKRRRIQAGSASIGESSVQASGNDQEVKDTRRLSASDAGTVYCNVQLATISSDPPQNVYSNM